MSRIIYFILSFFIMIGVTFAHHANEKYAYSKNYAYKIGDKKNDNAYEFEFDLQTNELSKLVEEQLKDKKTGLVSYILFENNKILVDENRKSKYRGPYPSHSVGKGLVSLVTGYAMCGGYINHTVFDRIDYPTVAGTLYENQKLIHLLNMQAGDDKIIGDRLGNWDSRLISNNKSINVIPIKKVMKKYFKNKDGLEPGKYFNYSAMTTNVIMNYVIYKTGDDWNKLLHKIFVKDAKVAKRVYFHKTLRKDKTGNRKSGEYGRYSFYADRYDYLRIAKAMLDDWQNDTCEGKYLKSIFNNRISKENEKRKGKEQWPFARGYAGQFQAHYKGIDKKRAVMGMHGYGGQHVVIDFDNSRIVVTNAIHENFNYPKIVYGPIKKGK